MKPWLQRREWLHLQRFAFRSLAIHRITRT